MRSRENERRRPEQEPIVLKGDKEPDSRMVYGSFSPLSPEKSSANNAQLIFEPGNGKGQGQDPESPPGDGTVRMKRQIGLFGGIAMIVGTMIGSDFVLHNIKYTTLKKL